MTAPHRLFRVNADWPGGGFAYTKPFASDVEARAWAEHKARFHPDVDVRVEPRALCLQPVQQRQAGGALLQVFIAVGLFAIALAYVGPTLDGDPYGTPTPQPEVDIGELAAFESQALVHCQQAGGENASVVHLRPGVIACTDKHGRRNRSVITIQHRSAP